ncbi:MAG: hypothetical protein PHF11_01015 [Candidatus Omnitrophica bacterium]|nr:hypothetical protein [Candidatus Omnitrophota bacterium]
MEFNEIKNEVKDIPFEALRLDCDNNFEAVVIKDELEKLHARLQAFFGSPVFPSKERLSFQVRQIVDGFGGILPGQTLYFWSRGKDAIFSMLWPWKDGMHTTIKIIKK